MNVTPPQSVGPGSTASSRSIPASDVHHSADLAGLSHRQCARAGRSRAHDRRSRGCRPVCRLRHRRGGRADCDAPARLAPFRLPLICRRLICASRDRPAALCRHAHPYRQGPHLAAAFKPGRHPFRRPRGRLPPTARRTGAPMTCARAWISRCVAPSPTVAARSAPISIRCGKQAAISWPVLRRDARAMEGPRSHFKPSRCFPIDLAVDDEPQFRSPRGDGRRATAAFWEALRSSAKSRDRCLSLRSTGLFGIAICTRSRHRSARRRKLLDRCGGAWSGSPWRRCAIASRGGSVAGHCCSLSVVPEADRGAYHR